MLFPKRVSNSKTMHFAEEMLRSLRASFTWVIPYGVCPEETR
jgi:hypothetical protein